ncbi:IlvB Thiamine pyrophosphate-requiring enzymes [acetolactate synthase, pyruvate dehydrogenase (cytochrome), glyoxylate carboligase, phosphonopyruvate decarboxylase] [Candidatus Methylopumilus planktonicus]|uniref:thiamine pyrophosphate-binding protein n=1 Tax=Candidatus Methylopumilus planktonicus TaxID=1581557 RepID=UPI003BEEE916
MRVVDYIAKRLAQETDTVFMLAGGGAMFLNDALSWCEGLTPVFCHHEQTCSMAAESYARFNQNLGIANVTTGPGGINAMNGVFGAWTDSIPMIVLSGQVKRKTTLRATGMLDKLRQLGDQEVDIISLVKPITKMATFISEVNEVPFILEQSIQVAKEGRPGPVWIDIPIDIQSAEIDPDKYFVCAKNQITIEENILVSAVEQVLGLIKNSKRPIFLVGSSAAKSLEIKNKLIQLAKWLDMPICTTWTAIDFMDHNDPIFGERPGAVGTRAGNIITQKADLIVVLGSRLPVRQVSYNWENFGKNAIKIGIDIDHYELSKPMALLDLLIQCDIKHFVEMLFNKTVLSLQVKFNNQKWLNDIKKIKDTLPTLEPSITKKGHGKEKLNPYLFINEFWRLLKDNEIIVCADASASVIPLQIAPIKGTQRLFTNAGSASMGYELPAAIGAAFANPQQRIICMAGDGSIMLNIQELDTIKRYNLPIKIILLNNDGYLSIKSSQKGFFKREKGAGIDSGLSFPVFRKVADANEIDYCLVKAVSDYDEIVKMLNSNKPAFIEVRIEPNQGFEPKLGSYQNQDGTIVSNSLENMSPLLDQTIIDELMKD